MNKPIVSVVVIAYNASNTIISTLESIKAQQYSPLELIITDDKSSDNTIELCQNWLNENSFRFVRSILIDNQVNVGPTGNTLIGTKEANGEWIKIIGDDILLPDCIEKNVQFALSNNSSFVVSQIIPFDNNTNRHYPICPPQSYKFPTTNKEQYLTYLKRKLKLFSPTCFYKRTLYLELANNFQQYHYFDDGPFKYFTLKNGYTMSYMAYPTVLYRVMSESLSHSKSNNGKFRQLFMKDFYTFYLEHLFPAMKEQRLYFSFFIRRIKLSLLYKKVVVPKNAIKRYIYGFCLKFFVFWEL